MRLSFDKERVLAAIDALARKTAKMDMRWDWPCGVAYYGLTEAFRATGNEEYLALLKGRVDEHIKLGVNPDMRWNVNACAMGHSLITLYEQTGDEGYWRLALSKADYLLNKAPRFGQRVLQHTVSPKNDFPEQAWADTLFMAAFFLLRVGVKQGDGAIIDDALNQYYWHIEYLQDKATGLWFHGYDNVCGDHMSGMYWARANAWAAYTMSQIGRILPEPYLYPQFMDTDCSLREQLTALKGVQTANGLWRTVLNDTESYEELSASAGIAAAMVSRGDILDTKAAQKALDGVLANVSEDGRLLNVSGGTAVMRDLEGYRSISRKWTQGWGQGLALALLSAALIAAEEKQ